MSKSIDEELAAIVEQGNDAETGAGDDGAHSEDGTSMALPDAGTLPGDEDGPTTNVGFLVALLVMVGGIVVLFLFGFKEAAIYSTPVDQIVSNQEKMLGRKVRIEGELVPGTLRKRDKPCEYRFVIQAEGKRLPVRYPQCVIPDTFRDRPEGGVLVTVEGALTKDKGFQASMVMAKCSSKYDPKSHSMDGVVDASGDGEGGYGKDKAGYGKSGYGKSGYGKSGYGKSGAPAADEDVVDVPSFEEDEDPPKTP